MHCHNYIARWSPFDVEIMLTTLTFYLYLFCTPHLAETFRGRNYSVKIILEGHPHLQIINQGIGYKYIPALPPSLTPNFIVYNLTDQGEGGQAMAFS